MSVESPSFTPAEIGQPIEVGSQPERMSPDEVLLKTQADLNKALNMEIGHRLQSEDFRPDVIHLQAARDKARMAKEIQALENGDMSVDDLSESTRGAIESGLTYDDLMSLADGHIRQQQEIAQERDKPLEYVAPLQDARAGYVKVLMKRKKIFGREEQREEVKKAEDEYVEAFTAKMAALLSIDPNHRKAPYVNEVMNNLQQEDGLTLEHLSENHLHVLVDQLSREDTIKAEQIEENTGKGAKRVLNALKKNRSLRIAVGGALWLGSTLASNKGLLPEGAQFVGEGFNHVLPLVAGYVTSREVFKGIDSGIDRIKDSRKEKRDINEIASDPELTDMTLRTIYSGIEHQDGRISERTGSDDKAENLKVLGGIDREYQKLEQEESRIRSIGVKYDAKTALHYASELLLRKKDKIEEILKSENPKEAFTELCREMITEDTAALTEKQKTNKAKRVLFRAISVCTSLFANQWIGEISSLQGAPDKPTSLVSVEVA